MTQRLRGSLHDAPALPGPISTPYRWGILRSPQHAIRSSCCSQWCRHRSPRRWGRSRRYAHLRCHCGMCRKAHGAVFATYASLARRRFRLKSGESALRAFRSSESVTREFCGTCGSSLFWSDGKHPEAIGIALGTLDGDPGGRPEAHIYANDRGPRDEITDTLRRFDGAFPAVAGPDARSQTP